MLDRVVETISRYNMLGRGRDLGVAVSGGADSVCLLDVLCRLSQPLGLRLTVLHVNHQLRGEESDQDALFVRKLAESKGLPYLEERTSLGQGNLEEAGRRARLAFFGRQIANGFVRAVATAHTRDDQAETVLFRILRGTGVTGLAGILPVTREGLIRPLLAVSRSEVLEYARSYGLAWRDDSSNRDPRFARNRIRHQWLPGLSAAFNPKLSTALANLAEVVQAEESHWDQTVEGWKSICTNEPILFKRGAFLALDTATQRRIIRLMVRSSTPAEIGLQHVDAIITLIRRDRGDGRLRVPGVEVERSFDWVRLCKFGFRRPAGQPVAILPGEPVPWGAGEIQLELIPAERVARGESLYNEGSCLDGELAGGPLTLRSWRPGDRLDRRKLKDLFQEFRVPRWERAEWPILAARGEIVWARRFGVAFAFLPNSQTRSLLLVHDRPAHESKTASSASLTLGAAVRVGSTECE